MQDYLSISEYLFISGFIILLLPVFLLMKKYGTNKNLIITFVVTIVPFLYLFSGEQIFFNNSEFDGGIMRYMSIFYLTGLFYTITLSSLLLLTLIQFLRKKKVLKILMLVNSLIAAILCSALLLATITFIHMKMFVNLT